MAADPGYIAEWQHGMLDEAMDGMPIVMLSTDGHSIAGVPVEHIEAATRCGV